MERMEEPPATWLDAVTAAHPAPPLTLEGERGPARAAGPASDALSETDQDPTPAAGLQDGSPADPQAGQPAEQRSGQDPVQGAEQGMDRYPGESQGLRGGEGSWQGAAALLA